MPVIGLRKAIQSVQDYIFEFKDILFKNIDQVTIEETELSEDENFWLITISFDREISSIEENQPFGMTALKTLVPQNRDYKIFKIDSSTGVVKSMKMYKL